MCESKVDPSKVWGVYEEWGWISVKVYQVYANEFEVNYTNASVSEVSLSLSEAIWEVQYLWRGEGSSELRYYLWSILYCEAKCELLFLK